MECKQSDAGYCCPACTEARYCSVACYKKHKTSCQGKTVVEEKTQVWVDPQDRWTKRLSDEQKAKLWKSTDLRVALANPELQDIIRSIDSSMDPRRALEESLLSHPKLSLFVSEVLEVLEAIE